MPDAAVLKGRGNGIKSGGYDWQASRTGTGAIAFSTNPRVMAPGYIWLLNLAIRFRSIGSWSSGSPRCVPIEVYGPSGESCMEAHHKVPIEQLQPDSVTIVGDMCAILEGR